MSIFKSDVNILEKGTREMRSFHLELNRDLDKGNEICLKNFILGGDIVQNKIFIEILEARESSVGKRGLKRTL